MVVSAFNIVMPVVDWRMNVVVTLRILFIWPQSVLWLDHYWATVPPVRHLVVVNQIEGQSLGDCLSVRVLDCHQPLLISCFVLRHCSSDKKASPVLLGCSSDALGCTQLGFTIAIAIAIYDDRETM